MYPPNDWFRSLSSARTANRARAGAPPSKCRPGRQAAPPLPWNVWSTPSACQTPHHEAGATTTQRPDRFHHGPDAVSRTNEDAHPTVRLSSKPSKQNHKNRRRKFLCGGGLMLFLCVLCFGCSGSRIGGFVRFAEILRQVHTGHLEQLVHRRNGFHQRGDEVGSRGRTILRTLIPDGDFVDL